MQGDGPHLPERSAWRSLRRHVPIAPLRSRRAKHLPHYCSSAPPPPPPTHTVRGHLLFHLTIDRPLFDQSKALRVSTEPTIDFTEEFRGKLSESPRTIQKNMLKNEKITSWVQIYTLTFLQRYLFIAIPVCLAGIAIVLRFQSAEPQSRQEYRILIMLA